LVNDSLDESEDIEIYLKPLIIYFNSLESIEFTCMSSIFEQMFHTICLTWSHSVYYNKKQSHISILMQEIINCLIKRAKIFLDPENIFKIEIRDALEKIKQSSQILTDFLQTHDIYKHKVKNYFNKDAMVIDWEYTPFTLFSNLFKFMERITMMQVCKFFCLLGNCCFLN
jgi:dynein heavy chain, axonemal